MQLRSTNQYCEISFHLCMYQSLGSSMGCSKKEPKDLHRRSCLVRSNQEQRTTWYSYAATTTDSQWRPLATTLGSVAAQRRLHPDTTALRQATMRG
jgi:hypothetical protein